MAVSPTLILQSSGANGTLVSYPLIINPNVISYNNYITNQRNFYERTSGGSGWTFDQLANDSSKSRNLSIQSGRINSGAGTFSFNVTAGNFYNFLNLAAPNSAIPITLANANQIIRFNFETGGIWLQSSGGGNSMRFKLERSTSPSFTSPTTINNSGNSAEQHNRSYYGSGGSYTITIEDDDVKVAGTYYYRLMIDYQYTGLVSHWNWQAWALYQVYNSRSTF
jgi:hypothetical protein